MIVHCPVCHPAGCHVHGDGGCDVEYFTDSPDPHYACEECDEREHELCDEHRDAA